MEGRTDAAGGRGEWGKGGREGGRESWRERERERWPTPFARPANHNGGSGAAEHKRDNGKAAGAAPAPRAQINAGCMRARTLMMSDAAGRTGKRKKEETRGAMREGGREVAGAGVRVRLHWNYVCTGCPAVDVTTLIAHNFLMPGPIIKQFHSIKVKTVRIFLVYDIGFYLVST